MQEPITKWASRLFYADQLDSPNNADWTVNALAPSVADTTNAAISVRAFDDATEEGVGFTLYVPAKAQHMLISFKSKPATVPGGAVSVALNLYKREIPDNLAVTAWSGATALTNLAFIANLFFQYDSQAISLSTLSITAGRLVQFELTRNGASGGDTLVGDWHLAEFMVDFF